MLASAAAGARRARSGKRLLIKLQKELPAVRVTFCLMKLVLISIKIMEFEKYLPHND